MPRIIQIGGRFSYSGPYSPFRSHRYVRVAAAGTLVEARLEIQYCDPPRKRTMRSETFTDPRSQPAYSFAKATPYLMVTGATLRSWVGGRPYPLTGDGTGQFRPLIQRAAIAQSRARSLAWRCSKGDHLRASAPAPSPGASTRARTWSVWRPAIGSAWQRSSRPCCTSGLLEHRLFLRP